MREGHTLIVRHPDGRRTLAQSPDRTIELYSIGAKRPYDTAANPRRGIVANVIGRARYIGTLPDTWKPGTHSKTNPIEQRLEVAQHAVNRHANETVHWAIGEHAMARHAVAREAAVNRSDRIAQEWMRSLNAPSKPTRTSRAKKSA